MRKSNVCRGLNPSRHPSTPRSQGWANENQSGTSTAQSIALEDLSRLVPPLWRRSYVFSIIVFTAINHPIDTNHVPPSVGIVIIYI